MRIYVDTREKPHAIKKILAHFEEQGVEIVRQKLDVGDYMLSPESKVSVDRKQNLGELVNNFCQQHDRFSRECKRAQENGVKLIFLIEHGGKIKSIDAVEYWRNPRLKVSPYAVSGPRLARMMRTYQSKYGVEWRFCQKQTTGRKIIAILEEENGIRTDHQGASDHTGDARPDGC